MHYQMFFFSLKLNPGKKINKNKNSLFNNINTCAKLNPTR